MNELTNRFGVEDAERIRKNVPEELQNTPQWVSFQIGPNPEGGKPKKAPINPKTGNHAKSNNLKTWSLFEKAIEFTLKEKLNGIGFVFTKNDPFFGIDIDNCVFRGVDNNKAIEAMHYLKTYTEISPSGEGIHIIGIDKSGGGENFKYPFELYWNKQYFTFTGKVYPGYDKMRDCQNELKQFLNEIFGKIPNQKKVERKQTKSKSVHIRVGEGNSLTIDEIISMGKGCKKNW